MDGRSAPRLVIAGGGARVLVADHHEPTRALFLALLTRIDGVGDVVDAVDGPAAVSVAQAMPVDVAILDLNMPRLDGVAAAARITAHRPNAAIALHSSDVEVLERRARGLGLALFDKADFDRLVAWVASRLARVRTAHPAAAARDRSCPSCGYGIACATPPSRCPMCGQTARWRLAVNARVCAE